MSIIAFKMKDAERTDRGVGTIREGEGEGEEEASTDKSSDDGVVYTKDSFSQDVTMMQDERLLKAFDLMSPDSRHEREEDDELQKKKKKKWNNNNNNNNSNDSDDSPLFARRSTRRNNKKKN